MTCHHTPRILRVLADTSAGIPQFQYTKRFDYCEVYELDSIDLSSYRGVILSGSCDQVYLSEHGRILEQWVCSGGRLLINGHPMRPWIQGLPTWRKLHFRGKEDLRLYRVHPHPIFDGINMEDLFLRLPSPGPHTREEREDYGVGGFYARAYLGDVPHEARVAVGIGPHRLPVDVDYSLGEGIVFVHCGLDLDYHNEEFFDTPVDMRQRVISYLAGGI